MYRSGSPTLDVRVISMRKDPPVYSPRSMAYSAHVSCFTTPCTATPDASSGTGSEQSGYAQRPWHRHSPASHTPCPLQSDGHPGVLAPPNVKSPVATIAKHCGPSGIACAFTDTLYVPARGATTNTSSLLLIRSKFGCATPFGPVHERLFPSHIFPPGPVTTRSRSLFRTMSAVREEGVSVHESVTLNACPSLTAKLHANTSPVCVHATACGPKSSINHSAAGPPETAGVKRRIFVRVSAP
mmetsp:Transcript_63091/g.150554  ORF Transcript_63091/g.150554 Transcript_63091/m.150554 type:complete len:241 (-) Transcript_63091:1364-2086(-)